MQMLHNLSEKINYYDLYYQDLSCPYLNTDIIRYLFIDNFM